MNAHLVKVNGYGYWEIPRAGSTSTKYALDHAARNGNGLVFAIARHPIWRFFSAHRFYCINIGPFLLSDVIERLPGLASKRPIFSLQSELLDKAHYDRRFVLSEDRQLDLSEIGLDMPIEPNKPKAWPEVSPSVMAFLMDFYDKDFSLLEPI